MADRIKGKSRSLYTFDREILSSKAIQSFIGVDEAGRGPLAGPVVAGAAVLDLSKPIQGINDSKKLSAQERDCLYEEITGTAIAWAVGIASHEEIDKINILQATFLAMKRALDNLNHAIEFLLIDGDKVIPTIKGEIQEAVVQGDGRSASIAAASILAKVTRDRIMQNYDTQYPEYDFKTNKGYATAEHRKSILDKGLCAIHRRSFCGALMAYQTELQF